MLVRSTLMHVAINLWKELKCLPEIFMAYFLKSLFLAINKNAIGKIYMFINYCKTFNLYEFFCYFNRITISKQIQDVIRCRRKKTSEFMVHPANHSHFFQNFPTVLWNWFSAAQAGSKIPVSLRAELWWAKNKTQAGFYRTGMETDAIGIHWSSCRNEWRKKKITAFFMIQIPTDTQRKKAS